MSLPKCRNCGERQVGYDWICLKCGYQYTPDSRAICPMCGEETLE